MARTPPVSRTVTVTDHSATPGREVMVQVEWTQRPYGGWFLRRADNQRVLGWVTRPVAREWWDVRVHSDAYRGTGPDDPGSSLEVVPLHLYAGTDRVTSLPISSTRQFNRAARDIVQWLVTHHAPAVGYGPHPAVTVARQPVPA